MQTSEQGRFQNSGMSGQKGEDLRQKNGKRSRKLEYLCRVRAEEISAHWVRFCAFSPEQCQALCHNLQTDPSVQMNHKNWALFLNTHEVATYCES